MIHQTLILGRVPLIKNRTALCAVRRRASYDQTAKLWDIKGNLLADLKGHSGILFYAEFSPNGKCIVTASDDKTALIWLTPEGIMEYLKTSRITKLTKEEKKELGIEGFNID